MNTYYDDFLASIYFDYSKSDGDITYRWIGIYANYFTADQIREMLQFAVECSIKAVQKSTEINLLNEIEKI